MIKMAFLFLLVAMVVGLLNSGVAAGGSPFCFVYKQIFFKLY